MIQLSHCWAFIQEENILLKHSFPLSELKHSVTFMAMCITEEFTAEKRIIMKAYAKLMPKSPSIHIIFL